MLHIGSSPADGIHRPGIYRLRLTSTMIVARDFAAIGAGVGDLRVAGIGSDVAALAATDVVPVRTVDSSIRARAGDPNGGVILLRAVNVVRKAIVCGDVVKLRGRLVVNAGPTLRSISGDGGPAVVAVDQAIWVCGIDPQSVVVPMRHAEHVESLAAIIRTVNAGIENVDRVGGFRISENVRVIPGALAESVIVR